LPVPSRARLAVALAAAAGLVYQIALTRILSVVLWYHFAFLAIALAMLGIGAPGVWFALKRPTPRALPRALLGAGIALPLSVLVIVKLGGFLSGGGAQAVAGGGFPIRVALVVAAVLVATLSLGAAVCLLLLRAPGREVGRMYGADLIGATVGALAVVPLLGRVPTPALVAGCGILPLVAAALVDRRAVRKAAAAAIALAALLGWGEPFQLRYAKYYDEPEGRILWEKWTPTARLTAFSDPFFTRDPSLAFLWGPGSRYAPGRIEQLWLEQDGSAGTPILRYSGDPSALAHLDYDVTSVGYQLRPPRRVCVIGAGGGRDVLSALRSGASEVDAVELNGEIVRALGGRFREFSGNPYGLPGVRATVAEGRSFLTRSAGGYDLIQIALVDSWAATAAGAFALSENYLYTEEAFKLYLEKLSPRGLLSVSRWYKGLRGVESGRLVLLGARAVEDMGLVPAGRHLAVLQGEAIVTLLVSREAFTSQDVAAMDRIARERGFTRHWPPLPGEQPASILSVLLREGPTASEVPGSADLSIPVDDRPFFFQTRRLVGGEGSAVPTSSGEHAVALLRGLLAGIGVLTLAFFFLPFALAGRLPRGPGFWRGSAYFASIGVGFMLVEAGFVQRFILFLGHPSYATTVVLAALLLGAGAGSLISARVPFSRVAAAAPALPVAVAGVNLLLGPAFAAGLGWPVSARVLVSAAFLVPTGFLMGFAFPLGMVRFGDEGKPWFWAVNGAAGVFATVLSLAVALVAGFRVVVLLGAVAYAAAVALLGTAADLSGDERARGARPLQIPWKANDRGILKPGVPIAEATGGGRDGGDPGPGGKKWRDTGGGG
jgi:hypothetical protein